jgi:hypothetical protein
MKSAETLKSSPRQFLLSQKNLGSKVLCMYQNRERHCTMPFFLVHVKDRQESIVNTGSQMTKLVRFKVKKIVGCPLKIVSPGIVLN